MKNLAWKALSIIAFLIMTALIVRLSFCSIALIKGHILCIIYDDMSFKSYLEFIFLDAMGIIADILMLVAFGAIEIVIYFMTIKEVFNMKFLDSLDC